MIQLTLMLCLKALGPGSPTFLSLLSLETNLGTFSVLFCGPEPLPPLLFLPVSVMVICDQNQPRVLVMPDECHHLKYPSSVSTSTTSGPSGYKLI